MSAAGSPPRSPVPLLTSALSLPPASPSPSFSPTSPLPITPRAIPDSANSYLSTDRPQNNQVVTLGYFRSTADVHVFAHKKFHRDVWTNYFAIPEKEREGLEIWHELYTVRLGSL